MLAGAEIQRLVESGEIGIDPFDPDLLNPNSLDLRIGDEVLACPNRFVERVAHRGRAWYDLREKEWVDERANSEPRPGGDAEPFLRVALDGRGTLFRPGTLVLAPTLERTNTPKHAVTIHGKSSAARMFCRVSEHAGFGDVGFDGVWTLQLTFGLPMRIRRHDRIAQAAFHTIEGSDPHHPTHRYDGSYQGSAAVAPAAPKR